MGWCSILLVNHDALDQIAKDRHIGQKIVDAIHNLRRPPFKQTNVHSNGFAAAITTILSKHAEDLAIVAAEHGCAYPILGSLPEWSKAEERLAQIVRGLGYEVVKKKG